MAVFRVWSRIQRVGEEGFLTTIAAVPAVAPQDHRVESETRLYTTKDDAVRACSELVFDWVRRLERAGHEVAAVEAV
jgi:hypothetical protein